MLRFNALHHGQCHDAVLHSGTSRRIVSHRVTSHMYMHVRHVGNSGAYCVHIVHISRVIYLGGSLWMTRQRDDDRKKRFGRALATRSKTASGGLPRSFEQDTTVAPAQMSEMSSSSLSTGSPACRGARAALHTRTKYRHRHPRPRPLSVRLRARATVL